MQTPRRYRGQETLYTTHLKHLSRTRYTVFWEICSRNSYIQGKVESGLRFLRGRIKNYRTCEKGLICQFLLSREGLMLSALSRLESDSAGVPFVLPRGSLGFSYWSPIAKDIFPYSLLNIWRIRHCDCIHLLPPPSKFYICSNKCN